MKYQDFDVPILFLVALTSMKHLRQHYVNVDEDIEKSKADTYREGMRVYISASSKIFPLKQLKYYLTLAKIPENSEEFIVRGLIRGKKLSLRTKNKPISYSRIQENFIKVLKAVNLD